LASAKSQIWPETDTYWVYKYTNNAGLTYQFLNVVGDTIIGNHTAKVIEQTDFEYLVDPDTGDRFLISSEVKDDMILILNNNDSIYFRFLEEWRFLFDFNAEAGDEYELSGIDSTICFQSSTQEEFNLPIYENVKIKQVDTFDFVGDQVEEMIFEETDFWNFGSKGVFRQVGPRENFLPKPMCFPTNYFLATDGLNCYYSPSTGVLFVDELNEDVCEEMQTVHTEEMQGDKRGFSMIRVFPNPAGSYLRLESKGQKIKEVEIYDSSGILCESFMQSNNDVDIKGLNPGLYFMIVRVNSDRYYSSFVKK